MRDENLIKLYLGLSAQTIEAGKENLNRDYATTKERREVAWKELEIRIKPATPTTPAPPEVER